MVSSEGDGGGNGDQGAGGGEGGGDGGAGGNGGGDQGAGGGAAVPEWLSTLPDDLKADPTLTRYPDVEKLARGALDLKRLSSSRVIVPGEGADETAWNSFFDAAGRPADPSKYEIPVPEGESNAMADAFRPVAHKLGLLPAQAKGLAEFQNQMVADANASWLANSQAEVDAVKAATPDYDRKIAAAKDLFKTLGGDDKIAAELDLKLGSKSLLNFFLGLADKAGEHGRIDGDAPNLGGKSADPTKDLEAKMGDKAWRDRINNGDTEALGEYNRMLAAARSHENAKRAAR